jgi:hypothetical protein
VTSLPPRGGGPVTGPSLFIGAGFSSNVAGNEPALEGPGGDLRSRTKFRNGRSPIQVFLRLCSRPTISRLALCVQGSLADNRDSQALDRFAVHRLPAWPCDCLSSFVVRTINFNCGAANTVRRPLSDSSRVSSGGDAISSARRPSAGPVARRLVPAAGGG